MFSERAAFRDGHTNLPGHIADDAGGSCYWPSGVLLLIVSRAKVATPYLEIRILPLVLICWHASHTREINLDSPETAGTMRRFDSPVLTLSVSYMHTILLP